MRQSTITYSIVAVLLVVGVAVGLLMFSDDTPTETPTSDNSSAITGNTGRQPSHAEPENASDSLDTPAPLAGLSTNHVVANPELSATLVNGKVQDQQGEAIADAEIYLRGSGVHANIFGQATSDTQGHFSFSLQLAAPDPNRAHLLPATKDLTRNTRFLFSIYHSKFKPLENHSVVIEPKNTNDIGTLTLEKAAFLNLQVLDVQEKPVQGALITVFQNASTLSVHTDRFTRNFGQEVLQLRSDQRGYANSNQLAAGEYLVYAYDHHKGEATSVVVLPVQESISLRLDTGASIHGTIVDRLGNPVAGVNLSLLAKSRPDVRGPQILRARSDSSGRFGFFNLDSGNFDLAANYIFYNARLADIHADNQHHLLELAGGAFISGKVVDAKTGAPIERFSVVAHPFRDERDLSSAIYSTPSIENHPQGLYTLPLLRAGSYQVRVTAQGYRSTTSDLLHLQADKHLDGIEIRMQLDTPLEGVVTNPDGSPCTAAVVQAFAPHQLRLIGKSTTTVDGLEMIDKLSYITPLVATTSDEQGRFSLEGLELGEYEIVVRQGNQSAQRPVSITHDFTPKLNMSFAAGARLSLVVRDSRERVIPNIKLMLSRSEGTFFATESSNQQGFLSFDNLSAGEYFVSMLPLIAAPYTPAQLNQAQTRVTLAPGEEREVTIELPAPSQLFLNISVEGQPLTNTKMTLVYDDGYTLSGRTDESGSIAFDQAPQGKARITHKAKGVTWKQELSITGDSMTQLHINLEKVE